MGRIANRRCDIIPFGGYKELQRRDVAARRSAARSVDPRSAPGLMPSKLVYICLIQVFMIID